ncbi:putative Cathepsin L [Danaus plexippus plexippus]|uniref:Cathepsin L n=2 Tax=Danaus plexippus TaxID=13037 RepID=A0A212FQ32_DANPL|nr:putative Cathepsin L [Danaus plexippus plexippus]
MGSHIDVTSLKKYEPKGFAPASLDYRSYGWVTEIKDQRHCNTCYIFSAIGAIEGQHAKLHGNLVSLSEQQELDCESGDGCKTGGFPHEAMNVLAQQGGSMSEEKYPYEEGKGQCRTDKSKIVVKVTGGSQLTVSSEDDLKDALANNGPLSIALFICREFQHYTGGIFVHNCQGDDGHAVVLVGYDSADGQEYWIIKNSWATVWGEQGYMRMKLGSSLCQIGYYIALASVA